MGKQYHLKIYIFAVHITIIHYVFQYITQIRVNPFRLIAFIIFCRHILALKAGIYFTTQVCKNLSTGLSLLAFDIKPTA